MKVYKVELLVLDFEGYGADNIRSVVENSRHMNASVMAVESREIGEWQDDNPLNHRDKAKEEFKRLFERAEGE